MSPVTTRTPRDFHDDRSAALSGLEAVVFDVKREMVWPGDAPADTMASVICLPMAPVPPKMRMVNGKEAISAQRSTCRLYLRTSRRAGSVAEMIGFGLEEVAPRAEIEQADKSVGRSEPGRGTDLS